MPFIPELSINEFALFLFASTLLIISPGIDFVFVLGQAINRGILSGIVCSIGICAGLFIHTCLAALGITILFKSSPLAFLALKYAGAFYFLYLAYSSIKNRHTFIQSEDSLSEQKLLGQFYKGFLINLLNPKIIVFFLAFLPQFIPSSTVDPTHIVFQLGLTYLILSTLFLGVVSIAGNYAGQWLMGRSRITECLAWGIAVFFIYMAIRLLFLPAL